MFRQLLLPHLTLFRLLAHHWSKMVLQLDLSARQRSAACPRCQHRSTAVHSSYRRTVAYVPLGGAKTLLHLHVRRLFCRCTACPQRIFAERFSALVPVRGHYSVGVCSALRHMGLAVDGRAGVRLAHVLGVPGSIWTILRLVHRTSLPTLPAGDRSAAHQRWIHPYHRIQQLHAQQLGIAAIARCVHVSLPTV